MLVALTSGRVARISARGVRQVLTDGRGRAAINNASAARKFDSDCAAAPAGPRPASPKRTRRNRAKWTLHARCRPLVNVANSLTSPGSPARGRTQTNPLMAGRRRRTPAAALRWRRCRCRCRSSSRSTCAGIECHSSPPRSTRRRRPRDRLCSMAWRFTTALMLRIT